MAAHSSSLTWKIPWTEEPGRLQSMGSQSWTRLTDFTLRLNIIQRGFPGGSVVKNLPANVGDLDLIPGQEDLLEKEMATHSHILA